MTALALKDTSPYDDWASLVRALLVAQHLHRLDANSTEFP